jgi:hypothetical protein
MDKILLGKVELKVGARVKTPCGYTALIVDIFENGNVRLSGSNEVVAAHELRFLGSTIEHNKLNLMLDLYQNQLVVKKCQEELRAFAKAERALNRRKERLKKLGLCKDAITTQLKEEFPILF